MKEGSPRINLAELKGKIEKNIGLERSKKYFYHLTDFLSKKSNKNEFDKLCFGVIGRENIPLHNQFICSILKNACNSKSPPLGSKSSPLNNLLPDGKKSFPIPNRLETTGSFKQTQVHPSPNWSNGVVLPPSPRKARSCLRDRRLRDRPSPLGPNGKLDLDDSGDKIVIENGDSTICDLHRPLQHFQGKSEQPEDEIGASNLQPKKRQRLDKPADAPILAPCEDNRGLVLVEDGEEVEQANHPDSPRGPLLAPLGIPLCPMSVGGSRSYTRFRIENGAELSSTFDSGTLPDTESTKQRMEKIATSKGLGGVSVESANVLNNLLDIYLKRLIKSCVDLAGEKSEPQRQQHHTKKLKIPQKIMNGMWPPNHHHLVVGSAGTSEPQLERGRSLSISLLDFKVAMELNPWQLGEEWPLLLEKICMRTYEE